MIRTLRAARYRGLPVTVAHGPLDEAVRLFDRHWISGVPTIDHLTRATMSGRREQASADGAVLASS